MALQPLPFFSRLEKFQNILIAGAGGGFDFVSGLPLVMALREAGKTVHLANLSFTKLGETTAAKVGHSCFEITAETEGDWRYFPEGVIARWFAERGMAMPIYAFRQAGVADIREDYAALVGKLGVEAIVLVDGGTDSLMRGDEAGLGTPIEDMTSIAAVHALDLPGENKFLACVGFGVDAYHGVCHAQFLEAVAAIAQAGGYLGTFSLLPEMPEVRAYLDAVAVLNARMPNFLSIVCNSIASAVEGHFGDYHVTPRTKKSVLFINPLMPLVWTFALPAVAARNLYLDRIANTRSFAETAFEIDKFSMTITPKNWQPIPH